MVMGVPKLVVATNMKGINVIAQVRAVGVNKLLTNWRGLSWPQSECSQPNILNEAMMFDPNLASLFRGAGNQQLDVPRD